MPKITDRVTPLTNPTGTAVRATAAPDASGEGFYQGLVGRKTGRPAPRPGGNGRAPRHEQLLAEHGLMDQGAANPNQGQLFAPHELPAVASPREMAAKHGVAPPLAASRPGFMPELYEKQGGGTVSTAQAHKRMIGGINRLPDYGVSSVAESLENRAATRSLHRGEAPWYAKRTERTPDNPNQGRFELGPGSATEMINVAAHREGVSYDEMSRASAITSPRTRWTGGTPGTGDYRAPNVESARNVVHDVKIAKELDLGDYHEIGASARTEGALPRHMGKAGADYAVGDPGRPIKISELQSQKVPNFNQSLQQAHPSQAVRKQAAQSYTVDTHDVMSMGADSPDLLKTPGGMAAARMSGRRSALRHSELPPMHQSAVWEGQRSKTPEPMGEHSMLETMRSGKIRARPESVGPQFDGRSPQAKRLGLEF
jgi:hypothetical protein